LSKTKEKADYQFPSAAVVISVIGSAALALSLAREVGFFWNIDRKFLSLFSLEDVITNSLHSVPYALLCAGIGYGLSEFKVDVPGKKMSYSPIVGQFPV